MASLLVNLRIVNVVAHEVFARTDARQEVPPRLSQDTLRLAGDALATFRQRLIDALGDDSHAVEMSIRDGNQGSTFQLGVEAMTAGKAEFLGFSQRLAKRLSGAQASLRIPGGLLIVVSGTTSSRSLPFVALLKAEVHSGFSKKEESQTITLDYLSELLLTSNQKLYKIGFFVSPASTVPTEIKPHQFTALVYDNQIKRAEGKDAALYFYEGFLGCTVHPTARGRTTEFYNTTREFVNELDVSPERKKTLLLHLHSYLRNETVLISVNEFADQFLPKKERDRYETAMTESGFPLTAVEKDISDIESKLRLKKVTFDNAIEIKIPPSLAGDAIRFDETDRGTTVVTIKGRIVEQA